MATNTSPASWIVLWLILEFHQTTCFNTKNGYCFDIERGKIICHGFITAINDIQVERLALLNCNDGIRLTNKTLTNTSSLIGLSVDCAFHSESDEIQIADDMQSIFRHLVVLEVLRSNVRTFPSRSFCGADRLHKISIKHNQLTDITDIGFSYETCGRNDSILKELYLLDLSHNKLEIILNKTFSRAPSFSMYYIHLSHNAIRKVEENAFYAIKKLLSLSLDNNRLSSLPRNVFRNISIQQLFLQKNKLGSDVFGAIGLALGLRTLNLSHNHLTSITNDLVNNLVNLKVLDISFNEGLRIGERAFEPLEKLENLTLRGIGLDNLSTDMLFGLEKSLLQLDLSENQLRSFALSTFANLSSLKELILSSNEIIIFPQELTGLTSLNALSLNNNSLTTFHWTYLANLSSLQHVDLSHNRIVDSKEWYFKESNTYLLNLRHVDLSHNQITSHLPTFLSFFEYRYCEFLNLSNNLLNQSESLLRLYVNHLDLSFNEIKILDLNSMHPYARKLSANNNRIEHIYVSHSLRTVSLYNMNGTFRQEIIYSKIHLSDLDVRENKLRYLCLLNGDKWTTPDNTLSVRAAGNPFACSCENSWMKMANEYAKDQYVRIDDLSDLKCETMFRKTKQDEISIKSEVKPENFLCVSSQTEPYKCSCQTRLTTCDLFCISPCTCYFNLDLNFAIIDCSEKNLTGVPPRLLKNNKQRTQVHLSLNNFTYLSEQSFLDYQNVVHLHLNHSLILFIGNNAFHQMRSLKILNLEHNKITRIDPDAFAGLSNMQELYLSHSALTYLSINSFNNLHLLKILGIEGNQLTTLPIWDLKPSHSLNEIRLENNPWSCECEYLDHFLPWLQNYSVIVSDAEHVSCHYGDNLKINLLYYDQNHCRLNLTAVWASVLGVSVFLVTIAIILYIFRREIQVLIYARYGFRIFHKKNQYDSDGSKVFNVFIAYSSQDDDFLAREFLPHLIDIAQPYNVCLHQRNFLAGAYISHSIMEAVERSKRTLVLLNQNFLKSHWCKYEFRMAHTEMMKDCCPRLILVVKGDLPKKMDKEIKLYMKTNTYLTWGEKLFWKKLYFALADPNSNHPDPNIQFEHIFNPPFRQNKDTL